MTWKILVHTGQYTERGEGFVDVIMVEKFKNWYYTTKWKTKIQFKLFQIPKIYQLLKNYTFWRITLVPDEEGAFMKPMNASNLTTKENDTAAEDLY